MTHETNHHCPICGAELYATDNMGHTYYACVSSVCNDKIFAVRGSGHFMHIDEIDLKTGEYWPWDCDKQMNVRASFVKDSIEP